MLPKMMTPFYYCCMDSRYESDKLSRKDARIRFTDYCLQIGQVCKIFNYILKYMGT